jgi:hypothetical protein
LFETPRRPFFEAADRFVAAAENQGDLMLVDLKERVG